MKILLTGFMGAGKTVVGERLAERMGLPFVDLDEAIEEVSGSSVRQLFDTVGEDEFRRLEHEELVKALDIPAVVVATGGGALVQEKNKNLARGRAVIVWLNTPLAVIEERLRADDRESRPLYGDPAEMRGLLEQRLPAYRQADVTIDVDGDESVDQVVERLVRRLPEAQCATS